MATEIIEMGRISARGQIAIPTDIRTRLELEDGSRVLFLLEDDTLIMKKITSETFASITKPLREAKKRIKETEVTDIVHRLRKK
ncbi:MAG: AbrB/MazE/SpoVT family DNA-binding domain-containing protein [Nanoarchaeota archaeon]|nr:AbrB/MazE/SpoVT family DNA-binding domain-containing protein [Nanoarchaeota archaeon]MBU1704834.1 AbrB/MazE/SpoVT family DNA-binding domain-containing protein [Nanoarchaeota archaeon]